MTISDKAIEEFKRIYYEDYNIILDDQEARKLALSFFRVMQSVYNPILK